MSPLRTPTARSRIPASAWKMAIFTVVSAALLGLLATLIGNITFTQTRSFHAEFTDATGVLKGDHVRLAGVDVGTVEGVSLTDAGDGRQRALVTFRVHSDVPIFTDAHLALRYENIVGQRYLSIAEKPGGTPMEPGATFGVRQTVAALNLTQLFNGFQPLLRALDPKETNAFAFQIVRAFQGEATDIASLFRHTASLTTTLADKDAVIGRVVTNLDDVLATVNDRDTQLTALIVQFRNLMTGLSANRDTVAIELPKLERLLSSTTGLIRDARPHLKSTVEALGKVARQLGVNRSVLESSLKEIPKKLRVITRTGSYGSWFNFYVCGIEVRLRLLDNTLYLGTPGIASNERDSVCAGGAGATPLGGQ